jgi:hypothetical protein
MPDNRCGRKNRNCEAFALRLDSRLDVFEATRLKKNRRRFLDFTGRYGGSALTASFGTAALPLLKACGDGGDLNGNTVVPSPTVKNAYRQTNLAATSAAYDAQFTISNMVEAWGIAMRPPGAGGHFWVLGGGTSWQFVGDVSGSADPKLRTFFQNGLAEVYLPGADSLSSAASVGKATGTAFNGAPINSDQFRVKAQNASVTANANGTEMTFDGSARFVFVTDSGQLSAWTDRAQSGSTVRVNGPAQLMYDGAALGMSMLGVAIKTDTWDTLWVADFGVTPQIRQFNKTWQLVPTQGFANPFATGKLLDAANPSQGNAARPGEPVPFNIHVLGSRVFVMYCVSQVLRDANGFIADASKTTPSEEDSLDAAAEAKAGCFPNRGKVVEYSLNGSLVMVLDDGGRLNAPWGVALAPADFGLLSDELLVGNFGGAGKVAAFNATTGRFIDFMRNEAGQVLGLDGTWALQFGNGASLGDSNALYFAAGTEGEVGGLFGSLRYAG